MREYSPADYADYAEECSMAVLFRRERQIGIRVVLRFCCLSAQSARSAGDFGVSIESSYVFIFPQIALITQRNTASCIISQRKTGCLRLRMFCCFLFVVCCLSA